MYTLQRWHIRNEKNSDGTSRVRGEHARVLAKMENRLDIARHSLRLVKEREGVCVREREKRLCTVPI